MKHVISTKPLEMVLVDLYGPLPRGCYQYVNIFVVVDNFTRYVKLYPFDKSNAKNCLSKITADYVPNYGIPGPIISDHGKQFVSHVWQNGLIKIGVKVKKSIVYHPQSNPAERVMRELGRFFRTYCSERYANWPKYVPYIEWVLNNVRHESTRHTPPELFLDSELFNPIKSIIQFPPLIFLNLSDKLTLANEVQITKAQQRKTRHEKGLKPIILLVGDLVLFRTHKLCI